MAKNYDLVIIGGGIGGYTAAVRAAQHGLATAVIEKNKMGGTCLHSGCIPTKALLRSAEVYRTVKAAASYGVYTDAPAVHFPSVQERKEAIVHKLHEGVLALMKKGKIDLYYGTGRLLGPSLFSPMAGTVSVEMADQSENQMLVSKNVILATGSRPKQLRGLETDGEMVLSSADALKLNELPASILIVGGGVIGVEWASMLADFQCSVTILEYGSRILPSEDDHISREMARQLEKRNVKIIRNAKIKTESVQKKAGMVSVQTEDGAVFSAGAMLIAAGREANVAEIGLENTEIAVENGHIAVNQWMQTKEPHIYAVGDAAGGLQLAHAAAYEGKTAVDHLAGKPAEPVDYMHVPRCVYAYPEAASVGFTESEAKEKGFAVKVGTFPFQAVGKALVYGETDGFVKVIIDEETDDLLGLHMIGPKATELIGEAALAKWLDASGWEIGAMVHPHPALSEALGEAALMAGGKAIHF